MVARLVSTAKNTLTVSPLGLKNCHSSMKSDNEIFSRLLEK